jgi:hypothetical protein
VFAAIWFLWGAGARAERPELAMFRAMGAVEWRATATFHEEERWERTGQLSGQGLTSQAHRVETLVRDAQLVGRTLVLMPPGAYPRVDFSAGTGSVERTIAMSGGGTTRRIIDDRREDHFAGGAATEHGVSQGGGQVQGTLTPDNCRIEFFYDGVAKRWHVVSNFSYDGTRTNGDSFGAHVTASEHFSATVGDSYGDSSVASDVSSADFDQTKGTLTRQGPRYVLDYKEESSTPGGRSVAYASETTTHTHRKTVHIVVEPAVVPTLDAIIQPIDPAAYRAFIPVGPRVDGTTHKGNALEFRVRIVDPAHGGADVTAQHPFTVTYHLSSVSAYKGYCMNYPRQNADETPDLQLDGGDPLTSPPLHGAETIARVTSYDYASYGVLKAHVSLQGLEIDAHLAEHPEQQFAKIPVDENDNHVSDQWERDEGIFGQRLDPSSDDDAQMEQRRAGDGYTMLEEYRGFKVNDLLLAGSAKERLVDGHVRLDPRYKDLFVDDRDGLFRTWYAPVNPSDLAWHYVDRDEMIFTARSKDPENRWMNFNQTPYFYAKQYALIVVDKPAEVGGGVLGEALYRDRIAAVPSNEHDIVDDLTAQAVNYLNQLNDYLNPKPPVASFGFEQPIKNTNLIDIYTGEITRQTRKFPPAKQQGAYQTIMQSNMLHEMGHAIGITHHRLPSGAETDESRVIGVIGCVMRYLSPTEGGRQIALPRTFYCKKGQTWTEVAKVPVDQLDRNAPSPIFRTAHPSNDCYGQIDITSDP